MSMPLVSIIIPTYNYAELITETLDSVLAQTFADWECIIVNDGSTDHTHQVVATYLQAHPGRQFKYIHKKNEGTSVAKNVGLGIATGQYIQFLDADDLLSPDKLQVQVQLLQSTGTALVFSASRFFRKLPTGISFESRYPKGFLAEQTLLDEELYRRLIHNNIVTISSPLVQSTVIKACGGFNNDLHNNEDWILWFKVALTTNSFIFDNHPDSYVLIRLHGQSAMNQHQKMFDAEVRVRAMMDRLLSQLMPSATAIPATKVNSLMKLNQDLLALHQVRSLQLGLGLRYIITGFIKNPVSNYQLLLKGGYKLAVRMYKTILKNEK